MARFTAETADNYGGNGMSGFFSLKNDKDVATIRFMYDTLDDVEGFAVHEVEVDGKKRYCNCLREYNEPIEECPLCAAKQKVFAKLFLFLYDEESEEVKIWERGKTFFSKLASLTTRYKPLVGTPFEIERNGKKGDTNTTYETFALDTDKTRLKDLPELPTLLGGLILDKTYEDIEYYLDRGEFPADEEEEPTPKRGAKSARTPEKSARGARTSEKESTPARSGRRTPANTPVEEKEEPIQEKAAPAGRRRKSKVDDGDTSF